MVTSKHVSEIYAVEMEDLGQGHPLWYPDGHNNADDIDIGDVGYIRDGAFVELFKSKYDRDDPANMKNLDNIPASHEPLPIKAYAKVITKEGWMHPKLYVSKSIKYEEMEPSAGIEAPLVEGGHIRYRFWLSTKQGALLYISHNAVKKTTLSNREFVTYIKRHHHAWWDHARNTAGIDIRPRDVILVQGFVKTVKFTVAAVSPGPPSHGISATVSCRFQAVDDVSLVFKRDASKVQSITTRSGPKKRSNHSQDSLYGSTESVAPPGDAEPVYDQCLFLRYFQIRWRFPGYNHIKLHAGAGPHYLPKDPDTGGDTLSSLVEESSDDEIESNFPGHSTESWLNILLEYILQNSDANAAIASHEDVYSLFPDNHRPKDFRKHLKIMRPRIHVDEDQVATLDLLELINQCRVRQTANQQVIHTTETTRNAVDTDEKHTRRGKDGTVRYGALALSGASEVMPWAHMLLTSRSPDATAVSSVAVSSDGSRIAASFDGKMIEVWNAKNGMSVMCLDILKEEASCDKEIARALCFSMDGKYLVSGGVDGKVILWTLQDIPTAETMTGRSVVAGDVLSTMEGHESDVWTLSFSPDAKMIASGSVDGVIKVWSAPLDTTSRIYPAVGQCLHTFSGHHTHVMSILYNVDNTRLISFAEMTGKVWSLETGHEVASMKGHTGLIWCVAASHKGDRILTGSDDYTCRIWDIENGKAIVTLRDHTGPAWSVTWSPDDRHVLVGSWNGTATINDSYTGERIHVLSRDSAVIGTVAWSPLGDLVCTGSENGMVRLWNSCSGEFVAEFQGHVDKVKNITFTPDGQDIFTGSDDGSIRHWCISDAMRLR
ncbi:WD40 repeat-like protein [Trametopsis cervina]|nr:WD40 repeat-like protein [Trametopsis cervina]